MRTPGASGRISLPLCPALCRNARGSVTREPREKAERAGLQAATHRQQPTRNNPTGRNPQAASNPQAAGPRSARRSRPGPGKEIGCLRSPGLRPGCHRSCITSGARFELRDVRRAAHISFCGGHCSPPHSHPPQPLSPGHAVPSAQCRAQVPLGREPRPRPPQPRCRTELTAARGARDIELLRSEATQAPPPQPTDHNPQTTTCEPRPATCPDRTPPECPAPIPETPREGRGCAATCRPAGRGLCAGSGAQGRPRRDSGPRRRGQCPRRPQRLNTLCGAGPGMRGPILPRQMSSSRARRNARRRTRPADSKAICCPAPRRRPDWSAGSRLDRVDAGGLFPWLAVLPLALSSILTVPATGSTPAAVRPRTPRPALELECLERIGQPPMLVAAGSWEAAVLLQNKAATTRRAVRLMAHVVWHNLAATKGKHLLLRMCLSRSGSAPHPDGCAGAGLGVGHRAARHRRVNARM